MSLRKWGLSLTVAGLGSAFATPLTDAARDNDRAAVAKLIQQRSNVNEPEPDGTTALHWAARNGNLEMARLLLRSGAKSSAANRLQVTPLSLAASNGDIAMAAELLKAGADANAILSSGENVLMVAARAGNADIVQLLLDKGAAIDARGAEFGETALMMAAAENQPKVIAALVARGAVVDARAREFNYTKDRFGLEGVLTILPRGGWTALQYAARNGATEAVIALATAGAKMDLADAEGSTPLLLAIINGHFETAAQLMERGASVNQADSTGMTPLYAAVDMNTLGEVFGRPTRPPTGSLDGLGLIRLLLSRGANPNATLKSPTLQRAHTPGEPTLTEGATPLMRAAKNGDVAAINLLLDSGAEVSKAQKNGATALMFACGLGRGVSAFAKDYATEGDLLAAATVLVARGADVNAVAANGLTAVHYAAQAADANFPQPTDALLRFIVEKGAKLNVADNQGRTPVDMAMGKGLRGRAGGPVKPREATAQYLRDLIASK